MVFRLFILGKKQGLLTTIQSGGNTVINADDGVTYNLERREMLLTGPGGIRKLDACFEVGPDGKRKLTTIILKGGNK